jgi:hypothetical protein
MNNTPKTKTQDEQLLDVMAAQQTAYFQYLRLKERKRKLDREVERARKILTDLENERKFLTDEYGVIGWDDMPEEKS